MNKLQEYGIEDFKRIALIGEKTCPIPLLHGTRRIMLSITPQERDHFLSACGKVMDFAKELVDSGKISRDALDEYQRTENPYFLGMAVLMRGHSLFEYGDFYVTSSYTSAIDFSHNVGGELGERAYWQCKGFRDFDIQLDDNTMQAVRIVEQGYEKFRKSEKIILVYCNVSLFDLLNEDGSKFLLPPANENEEAYLQRKIEWLRKSVDTDSCSYNRNFRLEDPDTYTAHVLCEKDFAEGFSLFTKIQNVERVIRDHTSSKFQKWDF